MDPSGVSLDDPMCDENRPVKINFEDVSSAAYRIKSGIIKSLCVKSHLSKEYGMDIYLKNDFLQYTGSFKERGALNTLILLPEEQKKKGVISASLGNHAQGLSFHGMQLGIPVTVVMPLVAPIMKIQKCKDYQANVVVEGRNMAESKEIAMRLSKERGLTYINGYDHPHIMAGQGTIGLEVLEEVPNLDAVIVPVGGGGLIAGIATAIKHMKPHVKIYGAESEKCPSMVEAITCSKPVQCNLEPTLADGLAVPKVGYNAFATITPLIDKMVVVNEDWIARAILKLVETEKCVVEGGGAVGIAAIMAGQVPELANKKVVCILTGGNIDSTLLGRCLERGLAAEGRLIKFKVTVSDRPGGISELCKLISSIGVSIKDIMHERAWVISDIFSVQVKIVCETRGPEHAAELKQLINKRYKHAYFVSEGDPFSAQNGNGLDENGLKRLSIAHNNNNGDMNLLSSSESDDNS